MRNLTSVIGPSYYMLFVGSMIGRAPRIHHHHAIGRVTGDITVLCVK